MAEKKDTRAAGKPDPHRLIEEATERGYFGETYDDQDHTIAGVTGKNPPAPFTPQQQANIDRQASKGGAAVPPTETG